MKALSLFAALGLAAGAAACIADDEVALDEITSDLSVWSWTDDVRIPNQNSAEQVGLAHWNGSTYMVHNGVSSPSELWWSRRNEATGTWSTNVKIPNQRADGGPTLFVVSNQLRMIYKVESQNAYVMSTFNAGTGAWSTPVGAGAPSAPAIDLRSGPDAVVVGGRVYMAYCKADRGTDMPQVDVLDGGQWRPVVTFPSVRLCRFPTIGASGSTLHVGWAAPSEVQLVDGTISGSTVSWFPVQRMTWRSLTPMSIVACGGNTHLVHGGFGGETEIWWSYREGNSWVQDVRVPNQTSIDGAALACANGVPLMVHNGGDSQLWSSEYR
jgi:hypothetical protein